MLTAERLSFIGKPLSWQENYDVIRENILSHNRRFFALPHPVSREELLDAFCSVVFDLDCFCAASHEYQLHLDRENGLAMEMQLRFYQTAEQVRFSNAKIEQMVGTIVDEANRLYRLDVHKLAFFVAWLVENVSYGPWPVDPEGIDEVAASQSLYGAFVERQAVCHGFARALEMLCTRAGIECFVVIGRLLDAGGTATTISIDGRDEDMKHAWNMVVLDGQPYYVDAVRSQACSGMDRKGFLHFPLLMDRQMMQELGYRKWERPFGDSRLSGGISAFANVKIRSGRHMRKGV